MKLYVVVKDGRYLSLVGPFQYPDWLHNMQSECAMTYAKAHQCAAAFGGEVRPA